MVTARPVELEDGYVLLNTEMLKELVDSGQRVTLPEVVCPDDETLVHFEGGFIGSDDEFMNDIVSVEYVGEEEVQCIAIDDENHLYITDEWMPTHNTSNIVFLKSTDDSMLDTLEKMSGKRHVVYRDSKNATRDLTKIFLANEDKVTITMTTKEEPVIMYNDMAFIEERNSIVFRAGNSPIWNQRETVLPMSWRLFLNKIVHPGHDYTLQTIPTLSSAIDFDVRRNQPDFEAMVDKRLAQAVFAPEAVELYKKAYGIESDYEIERIDPDVYSDQVLDIIEAKISDREGKSKDGYVEKVTPNKQFGRFMSKTEDNDAQLRENRRREAEYKRNDEKRYAGGTLSRSDLGQFDEGGRIQHVNHAYDEVIKRIFEDYKQDFEDDITNFKVVQGSLKDSNGAMMYIVRDGQTKADAAHIKQYSTDGTSRVFDEEGSAERVSKMYSYRVTDQFYRYLIRLDSWNSLAKGRFEAEMKRYMQDA